MQTSGQTCDDYNPIKIRNININANVTDIADITNVADIADISDIAYYASPEISKFLDAMYHDIVSNMDIDTNISATPCVVIPIDHNSLNISIEDFDCVFAIFASLLSDKELHPDHIELIKSRWDDRFNREIPAIFLHIIATHDFHMITLLIRLLHYLQLDHILEIFAFAIRSIFSDNIGTIIAKLPCDIFRGFVLKQNDKGIPIRQYYIPYDIIVDHIQSDMFYGEIVFIVKFKIFKVGHNLLYNPFITTKSYKRSMMRYGLTKIDKKKRRYRCKEFLTHAECNCDFETSPIFPQGCTYYTFAGQFYHHDIKLPDGIAYVDLSDTHNAILKGRIIAYDEPRDDDFYDEPCDDDFCY